MQLVLFLVSQYVHVVRVEYRIRKVVFIIQFRKPCFFAELASPAFVIPDLVHPYNLT